VLSLSVPRKRVFPRSRNCRIKTLEGKSASGCQPKQRQADVRPRRVLCTGSGLCAMSGSLHWVGISPGPGEYAIGPVAELVTLSRKPCRT
jgi:hypothetical protein